MSRIKQKIELCDEYRRYLEVIFFLGNGVILQSQFYEICEKLNLSLSNYQTRITLDKLEKMDIIKKTTFLYGKNKVIILRKFAIRYLLNKESSDKVASIPKNIDKKAIVSIFKMNRIINIIDSYQIYSWENFLDRMYEIGSSLTYNRAKGAFYHEMLIRRYDLNLYEQELYTKGIQDYNKMLINLNNGRSKSKNVDISENIPINNRPNKMQNATMNTLIDTNIHIQSIFKLVDTTVIDIVIMDINNTQNVDKIIENMILSCIVLKQIFQDDNIEFRFKVDVWDLSAKENIKSKFVKKGDNKELNYVRDKLDTYKVDGRNVLLDLKLTVEDIKISVSHIDIYKKHLGNFKLI